MNRDDVSVLRTTIAAYAEKVSMLQHALEPFTRHLSSEDKTTITVDSNAIRYARLLTAPTRCDGNHPPPACEDPQCWQSNDPVYMTPQQVWPSIASDAIGDPVENDTPPWMEVLANDIAVKYVSHPDNERDLKNDIIHAMKEAAREVALYFAAQPKSSLL